MTEPIDRLHSADMALLHAATTGEGVVELTRELLGSLSVSIRERREDIAKRFPELVDACDYETRLAVVAWAFQNIVDHASEGGTFRHLIYTRLGFEPDAYLPLYLAGGMTISDGFDLSGGDQP